MVNFSDKTFYQIYPKSFQDSNGDGVGDIPGIISRLDYLQDLGIDMVWISPFYPSPQNDNGYDVSDYTAIDPLFGTMADFEKLVSEARARGIDVMLDMVFNHTSTEHEWFQKALEGDEKYQEYYYLRPLNEDGSLPNNWESKFGGPAWNQFGDSELYYLCLYDKTQADLNWHNPEVRKELQAICNFWLEKGVKGFRFDVLNVIGKDPSLEDSDKTSSAQEKALYTDTPIVHEWVKELNQASFGQRDDILTVGEMSSTNIQDAIKYTRPDRKELDMIFQFHHLKVDYKNGDKWTNPDFDFLALKSILNEWQLGLSEGGGWLANFINNHDQPRALSRFGDPENYFFESASMIAQTIFFMRGSPYIYQGEEIGMVNPEYQRIEDYDDIETRNNYQILLDQGLDQGEAMEIIQAKSRDNSRTPMQWSPEENAGFTTGSPWLKIPDNYKEINVADQYQDKDSVYAYYKQLVRLRKQEPIIQEGDYIAILEDHPQIFAYIRRLKDQDLLQVSNFYDQTVSLSIPDKISQAEQVKLLGNGPLDKLTGEIDIQPYETAAFIIQK